MLLVLLGSVIQAKRETSHDGLISSVRNLGRKFRFRPGKLPARARVVVVAGGGPRISAAEPHATRASYSRITHHASAATDAFGPVARSSRQEIPGAGLNTAFTSSLDVETHAKAELIIRFTDNQEPE
jgi:hypothetical protein